MKVKIKANELLDADIEAVSLVKNAAMRAPFRILKTEEMTEAPSYNTSTIRKMFGDDPEKPSIAWAAVRKTAQDMFSEIELPADVVWSGMEEQGEVILFKTQHYKEDELGTVMTLNNDVAVGLDRVIKSFEPFPTSTSFADNAGAATFFPGVNDAMMVLGETIFNIMEQSVSKEEASTKMGDALKSFSAHMKRLVSSVPDSVIKMDFDLQKEIGRSTVAQDSVVKTSEDTEVDNLNEAVPGDLNGLDKEEVEKTEEAQAAEQSSEEVVAEEATVEKEEAVAEETTEEVTAEAETSEEVVKEEAEEEETPEVDPMTALLGSINTLAQTMKDSLDSINSRLEKTEGAIEEAKQVAKSAEEKAGKTVVHGSYGMDESLATLSRVPLAKAEEASEDVWDGILSDFDSFNDR